MHDTIHSSILQQIVEKSVKVVLPCHLLPAAPVRSALTGFAKRKQCDIHSQLKPY